MILPSRKFSPFQQVQSYYNRRLIDKHNSPLVSVIIPVYCCETTLVKSIESLLEQSYRNLEIIIVDDASIDMSWQEMKKLAQIDARIKLVKRTTNGGAAAARNSGLARSSGDYITFHDADDYSDPYRIELQIIPFLKNPELICTYCNFLRVDQASQESIFINGHLVKPRMISMMVRRDPVFTELGYFAPLVVSEDTEYFLRLKLYFGEERIKYIFKTLVVSSFSINSLLFSNSLVTRESENRIRFELDNKAKNTLKQIEASLHDMSCGQKSFYQWPQ
nr:glycosyltransferase family A protein [Pseudobacteriovorax antillogorgiicola]